MRSLVRISFFLVVAGLLFQATVQPGHAAGGSWVPCWSDELGIVPDKEPKMGQIVETILATVADSTKLRAFEFEKVREGARVEMTNLGSVWWSVKVGEKLYYPALWRVKLLSTGQARVLVPRKKKPYGPRLPVVEQKTIVVPGNQAWTNTGLMLQPQDRVTVIASGEVFFSDGDSDSRTDPNGWDRAVYQDDWPNDYLECDDPSMEENHAALLGKVNTTVFLVGGTKIFWNNLGVLFLGINDCSLTGECYNTGQFHAVVKVEREIIPKP